MRRYIRLSRNLKLEKGLSLVDALIGVLLIGLIGTFLMVSFRAFMIGARTASDRTQALYLAQQVLEDFKRNDGSATPNWTYSSPVGKYVIKPTLLSSDVINSAGLANRLVSYQVTVEWVTPEGTESVNLVGYYNQ